MFLLGQAILVCGGRRLSFLGLGQKLHMKNSVQEPELENVAHIETYLPRILTFDTVIKFAKDKLLGFEVSFSF